MTRSPTSALARLREAAEDSRVGELCRRHGVALLVVFGSAVAGHASPKDLDLAFRGEPHAQVDVVALLGDLVDLAGCDELDLMDLARADVVAREQALRRPVVLHESSAGLFAREQTAAITLRMDTAWLRRLSLESMAR